MDILKKFANQKLITHINIGILIRFLCLVYGSYHDRHYLVPYTDIDYKVFTDAARHVSNGDSPYKRHTYRYSPLIAYMLLPDVLYRLNFGKILFCIFDILNAIALKKLVQHQLKGKKNASQIATYCAMCWIYNPMSIAISTRGNADSVPCFFLILSLLFLQTNLVQNILKYVLSGVLLGISIHLRLYPLVLSFPMYLSLGDYKINRNTRIKDAFISLLPNVRQIVLTVSCITTLLALTYVLYLKYGYQFLFETYIYHLFRKDTRHNFSVLFYYSYITKDQVSLDIIKLTLQTFEFTLLFILSLTFGTKSESLTFSLFCQTVVLVAFNSVMTSQYFIWFLSLMPLVVHSLNIKPAKALFMVALWLSAQGGWLFFAYLLEFECQEVFIYIWMMCLLFFCVNVYVLVQIITSYNPRYGFGLNVNFEKNTM